MKKILIETDCKPLIAYITNSKWKIFYYAANDGASPTLVSTSEIEDMLRRSDLLLGTAPNDFIWCGFERSKAVSSLASHLSYIEHSSTLSGLLIIPYVDGGLIVVYSDDQLAIDGSKPAAWWRLHY